MTITTAEVNGIRMTNEADDQERPAGGSAQGPGIDVTWQHRPLGQGENTEAPSGAQVEDLITVCINRLEFFQESRFSSLYNEQALRSLQEALHSLNERNQDRTARGVEGTFQV